MYTVHYFNTNIWLILLKAIFLNYSCWSEFIDLFRKNWSLKERQTRTVMGLHNTTCYSSVKRITFDVTHFFCLKRKKAGREIQKLLGTVFLRTDRHQLWSQERYYSLNVDNYIYLFITYLLVYLFFIVCVCVCISIHMILPFPYSCLSPVISKTEDVYFSHNNFLLSSWEACLCIVWHISLFMYVFF